MAETTQKETREQCIARLEALGFLDPSCPGCAEAYASPAPADYFGPSHKASDRCESGGRHPHCTCDACF